MLLKVRRGKDEYSFDPGSRVLTGIDTSIQSAPKIYLYIDEDATVTIDRDHGILDIDMHLETLADLINWYNISGAYTIIGVSTIDKGVIDLWDANLHADKLEATLEGNSGAARLIDALTKAEARVDVKEGSWDDIVIDKKKVTDAVIADLDKAKVTKDTTEVEHDIGKIYQPLKRACRALLR